MAAVVQRRGSRAKRTGYISGLEYHADRLALEYLGDCPRCGAATGWSCISDSGRVTRPHQARLEATDRTE